MITSDHGMNVHCNHGGTTVEEREIPLFILKNEFEQLLQSLTETSEECADQISQLHLCGLMCEVLGIDEHTKPLPDGLKR